MYLNVFVDYRVFDISDITNIKIYLMKRHEIARKMFIILLTSASNRRKSVSLSNQKCMTQSTLVHVHPNEESQEFHYYPFAINLDRCATRFCTLDELSNKVYVPNETEDLNLSMFNVITGINESKILAKHISFK